MNVSQLIGLLENVSQEKNVMVCTKESTLDIGRIVVMAHNIFIVPKEQELAMKGAQKAEKSELILDGREW